MPRGVSRKRKTKSVVKASTPSTRSRKSYSRKKVKEAENIYDDDDFEGEENEKNEEKDEEVNDVELAMKEVESEFQSFDPMEDEEEEAAEGEEEGEKEKEEEEEEEHADSDSSLEDYLDRPQNASDLYFIQSQKIQKTSDNTLSSLNILPQREQRVVISNLKVKHEKEKAALLNHYQQGFRKWFQHLKCGFNLLLLGCGSKKALIQEFAKTWLTDGPVIVVNGYFPGLSAKSILNTITNDILQISKTFSSNNTHLKVISEVLASESCFVKNLYIVIHNIDGKQLRKSQTQLMLSLLAALPSIHIVASIDHIMAPLLWDFHILSNFRWVWRDVTTFLPYVVETSYDVPIIGGETETRARGIQYVLQSLTPNHRDILIVLAQKQLSGKEFSNGLVFRDFLNLCRDNMLVTSDTGFRTHLTEMLDHELVQTKRVNGKEHYFIPYSNDVIRENIMQI